VLVPNFCQKCVGAAHRRRGGHQKYNQSYQRIIIITRISLMIAAGAAQLPRCASLFERQI
jgi:hypothetical protein